eukprot:CAMPEP_0172552556 /NCGR_PEP_ID=MMETSP1067-20121228/45827_1 /TAXON_ID=265564 ORGANISM="Thalassiosira punctigera, Strain Tpunct2005C2" /NCGR_SAMPLE_ID=MMETSP1067 /ASSEMBLY_ACC=CAM_ASM_000444 /LENGTH=200 /DNA_ID=CAMNT_0013340559 /DNA_START=17 /DNA_END=619 /DNA_ORIENTATION=-
MNTGSIERNAIRVNTSDDARQVESESRVRWGSRLGDINEANSEEKDEAPKDESEEQMRLPGSRLGDINELKSGDMHEAQKDKSDEQTRQKEWGQTFKMPMKTEDGGSAAAVTEGGGSDAFSRYSDRNVRMMHLLGLDDGDGEESNEENAADWRRLTGYEGLQEGEANQNGEAGGRKTCLSWEMDPIVLMGMIIGDGDGDD